MPDFPPKHRGVRAERVSHLADKKSCRPGTLPAALPAAGWFARRRQTVRISTLSCLPLDMPGLFTRGPRRGEVPILNSACPWASSEQNLATLWANPFTSAITTRTATLDGFPDHPELHQVSHPLCSVRVSLYLSRLTGHPPRRSPSLVRMRIRRSTPMATRLTRSART